MLLLIAASCKEKTPTSTSSVEMVTVDMKRLEKGTMGDLFSKIELLPLETTEESMVGNVLGYEYVKNLYHIVTDSHYRIHVFDVNGKFISNSAGKNGRGPEEYYTLLDVFYNPITKTIEVLTAEKTVVVYDIHFKFVERKSINKDVKNVIQYAYPISKDVYLFLPSNNEGESEHVLFYDFKKNVVVKDVTLDQLAKANMTKLHFRQEQSDLYFATQSSAFTGYRVNKNRFGLEALFQLDFGSDNIDQALMKKKFPDGKGLSDYLSIESGYPIPMETLYNDQYIFSSIVRNDSFSTLVYNRKTKTYKLLEREYKNKLLSADYYTLDGASLLAITPTAYLDVLVDTALLDEANKAVLSAIDYDDNPVVLRFTLK